MNLVHPCGDVGEGGRLDACLPVFASMSWHARRNIYLSPIRSSLPFSHLADTIASRLFLYILVTIYIVFYFIYFIYFV